MSPPPFQPKEAGFLAKKSPQIGGVEISQTCEGVVWVKVGIGKSLCLCQVPPRLVPWGAQTVQTQPFWLLAKMVVPAQIHCFPGKRLAQYWPSTGPTLGRVLVKYWHSLLSTTQMQQQAAVAAAVSAYKVLNYEKTILRHRRYSWSP